MYDIIIVGAGTAGLTAAIYGARAQKKVLVFECGSFGGQIIRSLDIQNYPAIKKISGAEFAITLYEQAISLGAEFMLETVIAIKADNRIKKVIIKDNEFECKTIILATGLKNRLLGIEHESDFIGKGLSYCATCDGAFYREMDVAVIGGGNTAVEDAIFLSEYCRKVYLIHRRDIFRTELISTLLKKPNVELILNTVVSEIIGNNKLEAIQLYNVKSKINSVKNISGMFVAIGQIPQNKLFSQVIELDLDGYIIATEDCMTNINGVFAAGDCRTKKIRQLSTAASDGTIAALSACEYISIRL